MGIALRRRADPWERGLELITDRLALATTDTTREYPSSYADFAEQMLGVTYLDYQRRIAAAIEQHERVAVRSGYGVGKTLLLATIVIAFLHKHKDSIVITTGPGGDNISLGLWQYIRRLHAANADKLLGKPGITRWELAPGWWAAGLKPADTNAGVLQGYHAANILLVADEACEVATAILDQLEALMTGGGARQVWIGNPTMVGVPFYEAFHGLSDLWHGIQITADMTPNIQAGEVVVPGMIDQKWIDTQVKIHGADSDWVRARVHAEFPNQDTNAWVTLDQINQARANATDPEMLPRPGVPIDVGVDVALDSGDKSTLYIRQGPWVWLSLEYGIGDTMAAAGYIQSVVLQKQREIAALLNCDLIHIPIRYVNIDRTGLGQGLFDRLNERKKSGKFPVQNVNGIHFGSRSSDKERWPNLRQELWAGLRTRFREGRITWFNDRDPLSPTYNDPSVETVSRTLTADITGARGSYKSGYTEFQVESKDDMKKRIKRSPDHGDGCALAFYVPPGAAARSNVSHAAPTATMVDTAPYWAVGDGDDDDGDS